MHMCAVCCTKGENGVNLSGDVVLKFGWDRFAGLCYCDSCLGIVFKSLGCQAYLWYQNSLSLYYEDIFQRDYQRLSNEWY